MTPPAGTPHGRGRWGLKSLGVGVWGEVSALVTSSIMCPSACRCVAAADPCSGRKERASGRAAAAAAAAAAEAGIHTLFVVTEQAVELRWTGSLLAQAHCHQQPIITPPAGGACEACKASGPAPSSPAASPSASTAASQPAAAACGQRGGCSPRPSKVCLPVRQQAGGWLADLTSFFDQFQVHHHT